MPQLEHIEVIEKRLWTAADTLRANSNYASNEYFLPVMGLIFLRHAYSRYLGVKDEIEANLPSRGGKKRPLTKEDFSEKSAIFLRPQAQFDSLIALTDSDDRAKAIIQAMESIEADYENLRGVLPKSEYQELDNGGVPGKSARLGVGLCLQCRDLRAAGHTGPGLGPGGGADPLSAGKARGAEPGSARGRL